MCGGATASPRQGSSSKTRFGRITGWGKALPSRVLGNEELSRSVETSDEWIVTRTGIRQRYLAGELETASTLAVQACRQALQVGGLPPERVDLVICATCTGDRIFPATASLVQDSIGASRAAAWDVNAACNGFMCALATACQFIETGCYQSVLVTGAEVYSRIVDWSDRKTCVLFGDGAGAVLVQADSSAGVLALVLGSDGSGREVLYVPGPCGLPDERRSPYYLKMNGRAVFAFAVRKLSQSIRQACENAGFGVQDVDLFIVHQANLRILQSVASALGIDSSRVFVNVDRYGNTSAASVPIAIEEAATGGRLAAGMKVVLAGMGGGLSWGAMAVRW
jgi:3-oxoacyl-[acyl-carrier-protein] synthase-3